MSGNTLTQQGPSHPHKFTGWHMFAILIAFFGVVIAVNVVMARYAVSTFSGEVVENSYVASQKFNGWLDEAKAQKALGWSATTLQSGNSLTVTMRDAAGRPLAGAQLSGNAVHPLGDPADHDLRFAETQPGTYVASLPAGRWQVRIIANAWGHRWQSLVDVAGAGQ